MAGRTLVAGIGNIFFGDDAFGVEVLKRLDLDPRDDVTIGEYGIRGLHLAYELLDGVDRLVLVDAVPMGEPPGTLAVIEVDPDDLGHDGSPPAVDAHSMSPVSVLTSLRRLGGHLESVLVVACQPGTIDEGMGLSPAVAAAIDPAVRLVEQVLDDIVRHQPEPEEAVR